MKRILIVKTSSMGDVVHSLPIVADMRAAMPDTIIDWVVEEGFADIVRMHPGVSAVIPVAWRRWRKSLFSKETSSEMRDFHYRLKRDEYDAVIDTQGLIKSAVIARMVRTETRFGYSTEVAREPLAARFYTNVFVIPKNAHAVERNRWLAGAAFDYYPDENRLDYGLTAGKLPRDSEKPYVLFIHATSRANKQWPIAHWSALGRTFNSRGYQVALPWGTEAERKTALTIADGLVDALVLPGLRLNELADWIAQAGFVIGVDTGLLHLAGAFTRPTIGIHLTSSPGLTGVYCGKMGVNIGDIGQCPSVDAVTEEVDRLFNRIRRQ